MKTRAIGYVRVSTEEQAAEGQSLVAQRARLEAYCVASDLELVAVLSDEGLSGKTLWRPGVQEALGRLRGGEAQALIVTKLDRLSRSVRDVLGLVEECGKEGWGLHSLNEKLDTSSAVGRCFVTIIAAMNQMEREQIGERTKAVMADMKRRGLRVGSVPYGFKVGKDGRTLERVEPESVVIFRILKDRMDGCGYAEIARALNKDGVSTKRGKLWRHTQVRNVVLGARNG